MQESIIPLITAMTILCIITLLFFINEFFRKYKIVKKRKTRKIKVYPKPSKLTNEELNDIIFNAKKSQKYLRYQEFEAKFNQNNTK